VPDLVLPCTLCRCWHCARAHRDASSTGLPTRPDRCRCTRRGYLHRRRRRPGDATHINGMGLSYVAMLTAFYVDNGPHLPLRDRLRSSRSGWCQASSESRCFPGRPPAGTELRQHVDPQADVTQLRRRRGRSADCYGPLSWRINVLSGNGVHGSGANRACRDQSSLRPAPGTCANSLSEPSGLTCRRRSCQGLAAAHERLVSR
jgi:hypothetical protein